MAALDGILVDHASMAALVGDMQAHTGQMQQRLDQLMTDLAPLAGSFEGRARDAHVRAQSRWNTLFEEVRGVLGQAASTVTTAHEGYRAADAFGAGLFDAIG
jgi:6 kDa early secretory antigenic target